MDKECGGAYLGRRVDAAAVCSRERFAAHNGTKDKRRHQQHKRPRSGDVGVASEEDSLGASSLASAGVAEADSTMGRRRPLADVQNTSHLGTPEADDTYVMKASSAPKVSALLEELELEVDQRCTSLHAFADVMVTALRNEFRVQLLKLPKKMRNMPMADLRDTFGLELTESLLADINKRIGVRAAAALERQAVEEQAPAATVMRTTRKRARTAEADGGGGLPPTVLRTTRRSARAAAAAEVATPAPAKAMAAKASRGAALAAANKAFACTSTMEQQQQQLPAVLFTPAVRITRGGAGADAHGVATPGTAMILTGARQPRQGEVFYSKNGSPLGEAAEMAAPKSVVSAEENALPASIVITTEDGREVCLDDEQQLTEEDKQVAFGRLQGLQNQMSRLMQRLLG